MCMKQMVDLLPTVCVVSKRQQRNNIQCRLLILLHQSRQTITTFHNSI